MRAWKHVLDASGCYERTAQAERKSALQDSGLVRTVEPCTCAQSRVPRAIATVRDALSNDRRESATRFERPAKQALALGHQTSSEARGKVCSLSYLSVVQ